MTHPNASNPSQPEPASPEASALADFMAACAASGLDQAALKRAMIEHVLPKHAPLGLLVSMAIRDDHSLAMPEDVGSGGLGGFHALPIGLRRESAIRRMRQIYEEISGHGFYSGDKEGFYAGWMGNAIDPPGAPAATSAAAVPATPPKRADGSKNVTEPNIRVTPAMREWLWRLSDPSRCKWVKATPHQSEVRCTGRSSHGAPTYVMANKVLQAGLIRYERREIPAGRFGPPRVEHVAVLTDAGRLAMAKAKSAKPAAVKKNRPTTGVKR